jgi:hypothetical protein
LADDRFGGKLLSDERFAREIGALKNRNADAEADNLTRAIITEKYARSGKEKPANNNNGNKRSNNNAEKSNEVAPVSSLVSKIKANFK